MNSDCALESPKTIALVGKYHGEETASTVMLFAHALQQRGIKVLLESKTASLFSEEDQKKLAADILDIETIGQASDIAIVVGGDGTMLRAARSLAPQKTPLVGVNQGRLGFMTDIDPKHMLNTLEALLSGEFIEERRMLLQAGIWRDAQSLSQHMALNEVVVEKGSSSRLIEFEVFIDGEFVYNLRADGLIVSTATGSTAYSLSANGAILHPKVAAIALVPLCPHSLTNRPLIVSEDSYIEIGLVRAEGSRVHFDGHATFDLKTNDRVCIHRARHPVRLLHPPSYRYFSTLRKKLHWNEQIETP